MPDKIWKIHPEASDDVVDALGVHRVQAQLLYNRGLRSADEIEPFLNAGAELGHDPFLLPDMDKAISRLQAALDNQETIGVLGDFDTDGLSGTAVVMIALQSLGMHVVPYIPHRVNEGHGVNETAVNEFSNAGATVMITVDCGTSSEPEINLAASLGIDTIVTDHHTLPANPPNAVAMVNPQSDDSRYPFIHLTGAGLAYKLIEALWQTLGKARPEHLLELTTLGTVSDVAPLVGENRYFVTEGLRRLNSTDHPGLAALMDQANITRGSIDTRELSFGIIPRINAAGRIDDALVSLKLLTAQTQEVAGPIAETIDAQNQTRRKISSEGIQSAKEQIATQYNGHLPPVIFVQDSNWIPGILGLIASSIAETYHRPVIAVQIENGLARASARSIPEFNMIDALRRSKSEFVRYGGHSQAAGFTIETDALSSLKSAMMKLAESELAGKTLLPSIDIDYETSPFDLVGPNFKFINSLAPFGVGNPAPVFISRGAHVRNIKLVGRGKAHLRMTIEHGGRVWDAFAFRQGHKPVALGDKIDVVYNITESVWNGRSLIELSVLDFRVSSGNRQH